MNRAQRIHCWLADRLTWVQYPDVRPLSRPARLAFFRNQMPAPVRVALVLFGVLAGAASLFMLGAAGLLIWAAITA